MNQQDSNSPYYIAILVNCLVASILWNNLTTGGMPTATIVISVLYFLLSLCAWITPVMLNIEQRMKIVELKIHKTPVQKVLTQLCRLLVLTLICLFFAIEHYITALSWTGGLALCIYVMYTDKKRLESSK